MTKIFKHLAKHWAACLVIIALLLVQAYGDLTLPDYTSKIVDTGIQQSGIADAVPEVVRDSTLQVLELLMTDADAAAVEAAYTQPGGTDNALSSATSLQKKLASPYTVRLLRADADRDTLAEVFSTPDIVLYLASAQAAGEGNAPDAAALDTVTAQFAAMTQMPGFSRDAVQAQLAAAMGQAGESELSGLSAQAVLLVGLEYQALGISDAVQMNYLMQTGGRMLGLTLLMVAAAVLVGLLASRVAAAIARDLRRGVFRRVVSFSASETDKFSTASLITRTTNDVQQIQMTCVILLRMVAYAPILGIGGIITIGDIQAFIQYVRNFTQPIQQLAQVSNMLQSMAAASERVFEFLGEPEEEQNADPARRADPACIDGQVTFDHVKFGYTPEKTVIRDFSCDVKPGQKVAIVGPTGAGKTTMVKLLMRFYDVNSGAITLDGHNVKDFDRSALREGFGMVLQDTWLFQGTIMENIRYGRLDATDEEVIAAAKAACADHFIRTLPGGYQMELNEDASNVSQGQKQLLTIARAILADNKILILDEATSSVDTRTEQRIQTAMDNLMRGRTSFVIAHRLSTIKDADLILVMRDGDIVEQGTHDDLLAAGGFYADLYNSQFEDVSA